VPRLTAALLAASVAFALTACGGGGDSDRVAVSDYSTSVCTALRTWQQHLREGSSILASRVQTEPSLAVVRDQFVKFYADAVEETESMLEGVEKAGVPDLAQGEQVVETLLQALQRFPDLIRDAQANAQALPVDNEALFTQKAQTLGVEFRAATMELATLFEQIGEEHAAPELTRSTNSDTTCTEFREQAAFG
jgi:hypothetical protein